MLLSAGAIVPERIEYRSENRMDLYKILGVAETADAEHIKKAYRKLVKECHPDTHPGDSGAEERFKRLSEAYAVLSDEEKRSRYDRERRAGKNGQRKAPAHGDSTVQSGRQPSPARGFHRDFTEFKKNPLDTDAMFEKFMGFH